MKWQDSANGVSSSCLPDERKTRLDWFQGIRAPHPLLRGLRTCNVDVPRAAIHRVVLPQRAAWLPPATRAGAEVRGGTVPEALRTGSWRRPSHVDGSARPIIRTCGLGPGGDGTSV
jgi:hypothetical protein